jgi:hypothetical protein
MQILRKALTVLALVAVALWMGGMVALGAIAAPVVFRVVPAPTSADAMTIVFRRFDMLAMACAAVVLLVEVALAVTTRPILRRDIARAFAALIAGGLAVTTGAFLSPKIAGLHEAGAIRGLGALGEELDRAHRAAVTCGNVTMLLLIVVIVLHVIGRGTTTGSESGARVPPSAKPATK